MTGTMFDALSAAQKEAGEDLIMDGYDIPVDDFFGLDFAEDGDEHEDREWSVSQFADGIWEIVPFDEYGNADPSGRIDLYTRTAYNAMNGEDESEA